MGKMPPLGWPVVHFLNWLLMWEDPSYHGQCHALAGVLGALKRQAEQDMGTSQ